VSSIVGAAVEPRPPVGAVVVVPYQAQVRRPSGPARVHPRGNGIVQPYGMGCRLMGRRQRWRAVAAVDVDRAHCVHAPVPQDCRDHVPVTAVCGLEGRNLGLCCSLCPWRFL